MQEVNLAKMHAMVIRKLKLSKNKTQNIAILYIFINSGGPLMRKTILSEYPYW